MGRITIFVSDGCTDSIRVVKGLKALLVPYVLINLTKHPEKRRDLMTLTNQASTPQVFLNSKHIGGVRETIAMLREWDESCNGGSCDMTTSSGRSWSSLSSTPISMSGHSRGGASKSISTYTSVHERYMKEVGEYNDPVDARLALPSSTATPEARYQRVTADENCIRLPNDDSSTVLEIMEMLKDLIEHVDNAVGSITYRKSFFGHRIIAVVRGVFDVSPKRALTFAEHLLQLGVVHSLQESNNAAFDIKHLYRLQCYDTPEILNSYRVWTERTDPDSMRMLNSLSNKLQLIEMAVSDVLGKKNFIKAAELAEFNVFEEAACELQGTDLRRMSDDTKMAFGINLYNLMVKYAYIKVGVPASNNAANRTAFYSAVKFNVGGHLYSLNEWESGILRCNAKMPSTGVVPFARKDPRSQFLVESRDPRIHFALNRTARPGQPINLFSSENLDEELDIVAAAYCEDSRNVTFDKANQEVHFSEMFRWFRSDFVNNENDLPGAVASYMKGVRKQMLKRLLDDCRDQPIAINYLPYDWAWDSRAGSLIFDPNNLKAEQARGIRNFLKR